MELAFIAVLVLALECGAPPAAYAQGVMVNNIQITGLVHIDQGVIIDALTIKPGAEITGNVLSELNKNAEALYNLGFFQTTPELSLDYLEGNTILLIKVLENPLFKDVVFKGNSLFTNEELRTFIKQQPGEVTNLKQMEQDISTGILGHYADEGYVGAYIQEFALSTLEEDAGTVYITISEGMIDDIVFEGNKKTKTSLLKMIVGRRLQVGQVLKKDAVEKSMQDL
jgi:outer membrane protein insertion porin family